MRSVVALLCCAVCGTALAGEGDLDTSFGLSNSGKRRVAFDVGSTNATRRDFPSGVAIAPDGRIVVAGTVSDEIGQPQVGVTRLTRDGTLDTGFATAGRYRRALLGLGERVAGGVAVMSDGRILVAASSSGIGLVLRLRADGSVDDVPGGTFDLVAFTPNNRATRFVDVVALPDGRILAAGTLSPGTADNQRDFLVARFLESGAIDPGFGNGGFATAAFDLDITRQDTAVAMALAPDGRIVLAGTVAQSGNDIGVAAFTANGQPDATLLGVSGTPGRSVFECGGGTNDRATDVAVDALGRIVVTSTTDSGGTDRICVTRLQANGLPDAGFGPTGRRTFALLLDPVRAGAVSVDPANRVYAVGTADVPLVADIAPTQILGRRLLENGNGDSYGQASGAIFFGHERDATGRADIAVATALQGDRLIVVSAAEWVGEDYDFGIARFTGATLFSDGFE